MTATLPAEQRRWAPPSCQPCPPCCQNLQRRHHHHFFGCFQQSADGAGNVRRQPCSGTANAFGSAERLSFAFTIGSTAPAAKSLAISSSGAALNYTVASSAAWLTASAASGTTPGSLNITANPAGLAAGTYNGNITITSSGASNSPQTVPVTFVVSPAAVLPTLTSAPSSLSFAFTMGGTAPAAKSLAISSSSAALNYTVASSATWLTSSAASGTTPGSLNITANPAGLAAGTYNGNITITSSGAANSPQTVPVTFVVTAATPAPTLTASPKALAFAYQSGSSAPGSQTISMTSSGSALSYTAAASGGSWLSVTPASGTTPGSASVSVSPASLAAGTYNGTITLTAAGASNGPQTVAVTLVVTAPQPPPSGSLTASPTALSFRYARGSENNTGAQTVKVSSGTTAATFTTEVSAPWISVTPASGTTPGSLTVSAQGSNMAAGTYTGAIKINAAGMDSATVNVTLTVSSGGDDGDDDHNNMQAQPYTYDPNETHSVSASWVRGMGVPVSDNNDQYKKGLLLSKNSSSTNKASAGAIITGVSGMSISQIGFDVRDGGHCTAKAPRFVITTNDNVVHTIAGCSKGTVAQPAPALGWKRMRFNVADPTQAFPPMNPSSTVKSMRVILDEGPSTTDSKAGVVVLDNIDVNGTMIGQGSNPSHD